MFKKKKENYFEKVKCEHIKYFDDDNMKEYDNIQKSYEFIKDSYRKKIANNEININIERLRLQKNSGKFAGSMVSFGISYFIALIGVICPLLIQQILKLVGEKYILFSIAYLVVLGIVMFITIGKEIEKDNPYNFMMELSLKALEEIEKELEADKNKKETEKVITINELQKVDTKNTISPVVLEVAATLLNKDSLVRKILRKIKK